MRKSADCEDRCQLSEHKGYPPCAGECEYLADEELVVKDFQEEVRRWTVTCFGEAVALDPVERNHRFLEEALELVQALGCPKEDAIRLVEYVYGRPAGEKVQEVGGVALTLAALCAANGIDLGAASRKELIRAWSKMEEIRRKQAAKPRGRPEP